ncbi:transcriptional regulator [Streptomyces sp. CC53]|uniref:helix-turn-helix domain-containing protein n=1 Tax=Streptomyces sp. CC53 TaxID=1906740 RepID=UPI0008DC9661|nr:helix-turn-helix domain-containing protein [Streptomyces sp. CC53]OII61232.1 transcriptional regulator [Streptomyces sp. CC53]
MSATIGSRLRDMRKLRGLTQAELARLTKETHDCKPVSIATIRLLEQERAGETRAETLHSLARVLRVPTTKLLGDEGDRETAHQPTADQWNAVRKALEHPPRLADGLEQPPTVDGVTAALQDVEPLFKRLDLDALSRIMPSIVRDADALGPEGRAVRVRVLQLTGWLLTQTRQFEVADLAIDRAMDDAIDRLEISVSINNRCWLLLRQGKLGQARDLAIHWADEMEPRRVTRATPDELCAWGWMLLRVSNASVRDNRPGEAEDAMRFAHVAAELLGRECKPASEITRTYGPTTVLMKRAENASIQQRPDKVLELAKQVVSHTGVRPSRSNRNRHQLDVAHAHVAMRQYGEAVGKLMEIHQTAPQWLPNQRYARDVVTRLLDRRRTLTPEMRLLAQAVRVPV